MDSNNFTEKMEDNFDKTELSKIFIERVQSFKKLGIYVPIDHVIIEKYDKAMSSGYKKHKQENYSLQ